MYGEIRVMAKINSFEESLEKSHDASYLFDEIYREHLFKHREIEEIHRTPEYSPLQKKSIDTFVKIKNGASYKFEEKIRLKKYNDILIETLSIIDPPKTGWSLSKEMRCEYIIYGYLETKEFHVWPALIYQAACEKYIDRFKDKFSTRIATSQSKYYEKWNTEYILVPTDYFFKALESMCRSIKI